MPYDPKRLNEDRTPPPPRKRPDGLGRLDKGIRIEADSDGECALCRKPYKRGENVVSTWRNTESDSTAEARWHIACWEQVRDVAGF